MAKKRESDDYSDAGIELMKAWIADVRQDCDDEPIHIETERTT